MQRQYDPQARVVEMMKIFGQEVRVAPRMIEDEKERLLAANLVFEEAGVEFIDALGFCADQQEDGSYKLVPTGRTPDLVKAADAIGDSLVVLYGAACRLGIDAYSVFAEVDRSNKTKIWPDGTIHRRESDGKVLKPPTYSPADIASVLSAQADRTFEGFACKAYPEISAAAAKGQNIWSFMAAEAFGAAWGLNYNLIETGRAQELNQGIFAKAWAARTVAKTLVYFHSYGTTLLNLSTILDASLEYGASIAMYQEAIDLFRARFPKLSPEIKEPTAAETEEIVESFPEPEAVSEGPTTYADLREGVADEDLAEIHAQESAA